MSRTNIKSNSMSVLRRYSGYLLHLVVGGITLAGLSGCSSNPVYSATGAIVSGYAETEATSYVLQMSDADSTCMLGETLEPFLYSFSRVTKAPDVPGAMMLLLAAHCSEQSAWAEELRYLREDFRGNVPAATDAREHSKRLYSQSASRRYTAFQRTMRAYSYLPSNDQPTCPIFEVERDEFIFMMGILTGIQAVMNDANSGARARIPRNIVPQAERAARCLDNRKWHGLPNALRALVWLVIPSSKPVQVSDAWTVLEKSSRQGIEGGNRVSLALEIVAADSFGRYEVLERGLARYRDSESNFRVNLKYRLVDSIASETVRFISDKHWTANYGYRTPQQFLGYLKATPSRPYPH